LIINSGAARTTLLYVRASYPSRTRAMATSVETIYPLARHE
jgi:hypothetical protein